MESDNDPLVKTEVDENGVQFKCGCGCEAHDVGWMECTTEFCIILWWCHGNALVVPSKTAQEGYETTTTATTSSGQQQTTSNNDSNDGKMNDASDQDAYMNDDISIVDVEPVPVLSDILSKPLPSQRSKSKKPKKSKKKKSKKAAIGGIYISFLYV